MSAGANAASPRCPRLSAVRRRGATQPPHCAPVPSAAALRHRAPRSTAPLPHRRSSLRAPPIFRGPDGTWSLLHASKNHVCLGCRCNRTSCVCQVGCSLSRHANTSTCSLTSRSGGSRKDAADRSLRSSVACESSGTEPVAMMIATRGRGARERDPVFQWGAPRCAGSPMPEETPCAGTRAKRSAPRRRIVSLFLEPGCREESFFRSSSSQLLRVLVHVRPLLHVPGTGVSYSRRGARPARATIQFAAVQDAVQVVARSRAQCGKGAPDARLPLGAQVRGEAVRRRLAATLAPAILGRWG